MTPNYRFQTLHGSPEDFGDFVPPDAALLRGELFLSIASISAANKALVRLLVYQTADGAWASGGEVLDHRGVRQAWHLPSCKEPAGILSGDLLPDPVRKAGRFSADLFGSRSAAIDLMERRDGRIAKVQVTGAGTSRVGTWDLAETGSVALRFEQGDPGDPTPALEFVMNVEEKPGEHWSSAIHIVGICGLAQPVSPPSPLEPVPFEF